MPVLPLLVAIALAAQVPGTPVTSPVWDWPVDAPHPVVRVYLAPATPYSAGHRGVDIGAGSSSVYAVASGVVTFAGFVVDRPVLSIGHPDGVVSSYEPVSSDLVAGDAVAQGQLVGTLEPGHCATLCLHLGARRNGQYVSPMTYLGQLARAVLLPTRMPSGSPSSIAATRDGHQNFSPAMKASAGTISVRTMSVSSKTPTHTMMPI